MLKIITNINELNLEQFLQIYKESFIKNGRNHFWQFSEDQQVAFAEEEMLDYLRNDFFRGPGAFAAAWAADGTYKSALRMEPYRDGMLLHALETAPEARRQGCAYALIKATMEYLQTQNCNVVYSHIDKRNKASLRLHEKCGFIPFSDFAVYLDGTVTQSSRTMIYKR